ncbi:golvesin C-terminal-like domain-containing protein [Micromonospora sp. NPDC004704]
MQDVDYPTLRTRLLADGQLLVWPPPVAGEVILDSRAATGVTRAGTWLGSTSIGGYHGPDYEHDNNTGKGVNRMRFTPNLPTAGTYTVYLRWTAHENRAANVPVDIVHSGGIATRTVDQRTSGGQWVSLGSFPFTAGSAGSVLIRTENTTGYVVADATRFLAP